VLGGTAAVVLRRAEAARARGELMAAMSADLRAEGTAIDAGPIPPDEANAALHYEAAHAKLDSNGWLLVRKLERDWTEVPEDLRKWVVVNAAALADAEQGAALEACRFPLPGRAGASGLRVHPYGPDAQCESMSHLAGLFAARARIHLEEGRTAAAVADALRVPRVVRHELLRSVREGSERDAVVHRAVDVLARALRRPDLDAATERSVVDGLLDWPQVLEGEATQRRILALLDEGWAIAILSGDLPTESEANFRRQFGLPERGLLGRASAEDCRLLAVHRERWLADRERAKAGAPPVGPPPTWIGRLGIVRVTYAARVYERVHGRPPARIEDLVPDILRELPRAPSGTGPLRVDWPPRLDWGPR
ncbi:MAG TPA: hypothetical protein VFS92_08120, partial [Planctomycetota bacterium]|nr:hypothetical protein [Planctomycetota bacterium]